ncbi:MAG: hypothetical protein AAGF01_25240 [Cyanobacteria bacterium P01_G01_bin.38]
MPTEGNVEKDKANAQHNQQNVIKAGKQDIGGRFENSHRWAGDCFHHIQVLYTG